jgi:uncharacterized protein
MLVFLLALTLLALIGHAALCVGVINRAHSTGAPRWLVKLLSAGGYALLGLVPLAAAVSWLTSGQSIHAWLESAAANSALWLYLVPCWIIALATIVLWIQRHWLTQTPAAVQENHTTVVDVASLLGHRPMHGFHAQMLSYVPGNQVLQIAVHEKQFHLQRLPTDLDGFSIAHLSDLHITGRIGLDFFREVARQTNSLRPDLIAVTGDIIDEIELLDWLPGVFSQLSAPLGIYFVLGNHDLFTHQPARIRQALTSIGLVDLGSSWRKFDVNGSDVVLAGNELPWFTPAADMQNAPSRTADRSQLRILLAHSPDQFGWARRWDFDLMLAGHTHGGQISLPLVGPIVSPSWHGVKYASGTFYKSPTLMHVSRGVSAELPIRLNCLPELTKIVLRRSKTGPSQ